VCLLGVLGQQASIDLLRRDSDLRVRFDYRVDMAVEAVQGGWLTVDLLLAGSATSFPRLAERGQPAVDLGQVERLGFFRVVLGPISVECRGYRVLTGRTGTSERTWSEHRCGQV